MNPSNNLLSTTNMTNEEMRRKVVQHYTLLVNKYKDKLTRNKRTALTHESEPGIKKCRICSNIIASEKTDSAYVLVCDHSHLTHKTCANNWTASHGTCYICGIKAQPKIRKNNSISIHSDYSTCENEMKKHNIHENNDTPQVFSVRY